MAWANILASWFRWLIPMPKAFGIRDDGNEISFHLSLRLPSASADIAVCSKGNCRLLYRALPLTLSDIAVCFS
jgi:hypothetical protein